MNTSAKHGKALQLRDWLVESDAEHDPQAFIFQPEIVSELAEAIISEEEDYWRGVHVARKAVAVLRRGCNENNLSIPDRERQWLGRIEQTLSDLPPTREQFLEEEKERWKEHVDYSQYGLVPVHE